ncbi:hypothetical protein SPRG_15052 [Saprolegnia parasitica CBS 223.65]|uniref:Uncharacterized protein n=1 Tax=Saprolegnia parasitica (strain CBS 223.65) TaxID=695850 RepID=A0A067BMH3_SAPPC|nr:hypothetical protein SPRG_15052 [Saprolegnia parasitica CBS 223.65]KDO19664.1 hypothetical protein SPRG_15052 [Saprolegnia parasitica CBS 223.65]|eukprot:XP_012209624.1 hypothetical protein SPRG_15052 [Saprolegnia parasitica CBS 223.65]
MRGLLPWRQRMKVSTGDVWAPRTKRVSLASRTALSASDSVFNIPADYVVPDVPTTPTLLRGFRLGAAYAQLHQQSTMSPSRRQRFEMNFGITFTAPDTDL